MNEAGMEDDMAPEAEVGTGAAPEHGPEIVLCTNGPLLVRGDVEIRDARGELVPSRRKTVALCRCGGSGIKPFCDGTHKLNGFRTESP